MKQRVIAIVGPTASGKSDLAVYVAKKYNGEVVSADSRQVYRKLNIGTGKISKKEMLGVKHHLIDVVDVKKQFDVVQYVDLAKKSVDDILQRNRLPIICGGTGLYVDALLRNISFPDVPPNKKLRLKLEKKTTDSLFLMLKKLDPRRAKYIDPNNRPRLIRAIEIATALGKVPKIEKRISPFSVLWIGIKPTNSTLQKNINNRLQKRMRAGLIAEVKKLRKEGLSFARLDALGLEYRYLGKFLKKGMTKKEMLAKLQKEIIQYSKRQMTWFKRNGDIYWFENSKAGNIRKINTLVNDFL